MRVFVAGATGAIGQQLVPALVEAGHDVAGMTRKAERVAQLEAAGAEAIVCDLFDPNLAAHIAQFRPDAVVHQVTDLPSRASLIALKILSVNRARKQGTDVLIAAAKAAGAHHFLAQSVAFSVPAPGAGAIAYLEQATLAFPGVVARYGYFYGPGTWYPDGTDRKPPVDIALAAQRTVELLGAEPGVYEVVDPD